MKVQFKEWLCDVAFESYQNGRTAIELYDEEGSVATATVNLPDIPLDYDEVCIKDYSENEGMVDYLYDAGIVSRPIRYVNSGFVTIPVCRLLKHE